MLRIPRKKKTLVAYIISIFIVTFSVFQTSNATLPKRTTLAPSPNPGLTVSPVLGAQTGEVFKVTRVVDGDTIVIDTGQKVRLIGVDTPETVDPRKPVQCYGKEASAYTKSRLLNQEVRLVKDVSETDHFGRLLRYVYVGDELFNNTLVLSGYAHAVSYPPDISKQELFRASERDAIFNNKGLWASTCNTK